MKTIITYESYPHMNAEKVAKVMAEAMHAKLTKIEDVQPEELADYDLIGFGSDIYGLQHHQKLLELIERMPSVEEMCSFFDLSQLQGCQSCAHQREACGKGCNVAGKFSCLGQFTGAKTHLNLNGSLAFVGGKNKGYLDEQDLKDARKFAKGLLNA